MAKGVFTVANLTLREAAKHFQVSRPTLQKALSSGKITGVQGGQGHWTIDHSELARVYHPRQTGGQQEHPSRVAKLTAENTPLNTPSVAKNADELAALRVRLDDAERRAATAEALAAERGQHIEDLRRMLPSPEAAQRRRWWPW